MPLELQELSPKPDFDAIAEASQPRVPKLAARRKSDGQFAAMAPPTPLSPTGTAFGEKGSKESLRSTDDATIYPPSPMTPAIAPWENEFPSAVKGNKLETRIATTRSDSLTSATIESHSSDAAKQPFRDEVPIPDTLSNI